MTGNIGIDSIDHLVLTVRDPAATISFYCQVLGMREISFANGRKAVAFGNHKINLHAHGSEIEPKAAHPQPGSADLCLITATPIDEVAQHIRQYGIRIVEGPVRRSGAKGAIVSIYLRDPDGNLIEIANRLST